MENENPTHKFATLQSKRIGERTDYSSVSIHAKRVSDGKRVAFSVTTIDEGIQFVDGCFRYLMPYKDLRAHVEPTEASFQVANNPTDLTWSRLTFKRTPHGALEIRHQRASEKTAEHLIEGVPPFVMDRLESVVKSAQLRQRVISKYWSIREKRRS